MRINFYTITTLIFLWLCLMGVPSSVTSASFLVIAVSGSYYLGYILKILPRENRFNYRAIFYLLWLIKEILKSGLSVIRIIWRRDLRLTPAFEWIETGQKEEPGLIVYGNSITLTPGTVTCDVKGNSLLVHALESSALIELKGGEMDRKVQQILRTQKSG